MNAPLTTSDPVQTPAAPQRNRLWLWRGLALMGLLIVLWLYVLPYQTGVRLDQSLSGWVSNHSSWTLEREERSLYQRHYQLRWQPGWATEPVVLDVRVFPEPFGWSSPAGRQWGWATFTVHMDPGSPVQIRNWPDRAIAISGQVEGLGYRPIQLGRQRSRQQQTHLRPIRSHLARHAELARLAGDHPDASLSVRPNLD